MSTPAATTAQSVGKNVHPAPSTEVSTPKRRKLSSTAWTAEPDKSQLVASAETVCEEEEEKDVVDDVLADALAPITNSGLATTPAAAAGKAKKNVRFAMDLESDSSSSGESSDEESGSESSSSDEDDDDDDEVLVVPPSGQYEKGAAMWRDPVKTSGRGEEGGDGGGAFPTLAETLLINLPSPPPVPSYTSMVKKRTYAPPASKYVTAGKPLLKVKKPLPGTVRVPGPVPAGPPTAKKTLTEYHKIQQLEKLAEEEQALMQEIARCVGRIRAIRMEGNRLRGELEPAAAKGARREGLGPDVQWNFPKKRDMEGVLGADEVVMEKLRKEMEQRSERTKMTSKERHANLRAGGEVGTAIGEERSRL